MPLDDVGSTTSAAGNADAVEESAMELPFEIPMTHHLLPIILMAFVLLTLLLACLYDCKVNRDCCRKRSESEALEVAKSGIYLYDGETGESRTHTE